MNIFWRSPRPVSLCQAVSEIPFASGEPGPLLTELCRSDSEGGPALGQSCGTSRRNASQQWASAARRRLLSSSCTWPSSGVRGPWNKSPGPSRSPFSFIYQLSGCVSFRDARHKRIALKPRRTFECFITGSDLCRQSCTSSGEFARTCPTSAPPPCTHMHTFISFSTETGGISGPRLAVGRRCYRLSASRPACFSLKV